MRVRHLLGCVAAAILLVPNLARAQASSVCSVTGQPYSENFSTTTYKDGTFTAASGWGTGGPVQLAPKAGAFPNASTNPNLAERVYATVTADFDGDGDDDMIVLTDKTSCHLDFYSNNGSGTFINKGQVATCTSTSAAVMTVGDVDYDGKLDIVMVTVNNPSNAGTVNTAQFLHNTGLAGGVPTFTSTDISAMLLSAGVAWHIAGTQLALVDWNGDLHADLEVYSSTGSVNQVLLFPANGPGGSAGFAGTNQVLLANTGLYTPIANTGNTATGGFSCMPAMSVSKGGTLMAIADYNGDLLPDIVVGSVSENSLKVFTQNSDGTMTRNSDLPFSAGAPLLGYPRDMNGDGVPDLAVIRSGNDCGGTPGQVWIFFNAGAANFTQYGNFLNVGSTASWAALLNADVDAYNTTDVIAGKVTGIGQYAYYRNTASSSVYNPNGTAQSTKLTPSSLDPNLNGVVSVKVTTYSQPITSCTSGCNITMQVTNNGGKTWETLTTAELGGAEHSFVSFGTDLRWRALLSAPVATLFLPGQTIYAPAAASTPQLSAFALTYNTVGSRLFSRSQLAYGSFPYQGSTIEMLYSAAFAYPGFQGYLYGYDITGLTRGGAGANNLQRVDTNSSVFQRWEAGQTLSTVSGVSRTLYTAYPQSTNGNDLINTTNTRIPFSISQLTGGTSSPTLAQMMGVTAQTTAQQTTLMNFLTGGMGNPNQWKFFDPGHSSPVFVAGPSGDGNYLANAYSTFQAAQAGRQPVVYIGANDGMLHAFNAGTGTEMWGFVPYNLLSKMSSQMATNPNGMIYYNHAPFVDGTITVGDVLHSGNWSTVAVVGEAQGQGLAGNNYYFALDITNPSNPIPLWDFSDTYSTPYPLCNLSNNCVPSCTPSCSQDTASCQSECNQYDSYFSVSNSPLGPGGQAGGLIQAEHFDNEFQSTSGGYNWNYITSALNGTILLNSWSGTGYMQAQGTPYFTCPGTTTAAMASCTQLTYRFNVAAAGNFYPFLRMYSSNSTDNTVNWGVDGVYQGTAVAVSGNANNWAWQKANTVSSSGLAITAGDHTLNIWMNESTTRIDAISIQASSTTTPLGTSETCINECGQTCTGSCTNTCYTSPSSTAWPQCGQGAGLQCCGTVGGDQYCAPVGASCPEPETIMGQTFSRPALARLNTTSGDKWVAFFASGYNNRGVANTGRSLYAVDAYTGYPMGQWNFSQVAQTGTNPNITNTVPAGPTPVDVDGDGYVDRVYVGDLDGHLWKVNTAAVVAVGSTGAMNPNQYPSCIVFDAGDPNQTGTRVWAPIITKAAAAILSAGTVNLYFGTGGDDSAPDTLLYKFYSIRDSDLPSQCSPSGPRLQSSLNIANLEWIIGDGTTNTSPPAPLANPNSEGNVGDRYWSDPVINNGTSIYFVSLPGKIEQIDPCVDLQGTSKVYAYAIQGYTDASGTSHQAGQSLISGTGGNGWLASIGKVRTAAVVRNPQSSVPPHAVTNPVSQAASDVFIQNFSGATAGDKPAIQRLTELGTVVKNTLKMLRWREVPL